MSYKYSVISQYSHDDKDHEFNTMEQAKQYCDNFNLRRDDIQRVHFIDGEWCYENDWYDEEGEVCCYGCDKHLFYFEDEEKPEHYDRKGGMVVCPECNKEYNTMAEVLFFNESDEAKEKECFIDYRRGEDKTNYCDWTKEQIEVYNKSPLADLWGKLDLVPQ